MKFNTIEISGYTRFVPSQIKRIKIDFPALVQIILGTNGSGKSSLMELLTPLPPASNMFFPGGYVRLEIYHRGRIYTTISNFNKKGEHEFWLGKENLNQSGNESEQKKLVKEYFGITPQIHQVLIGKTKFTQMRGPERRDFLMMLSGIDFDYIMTIFKLVKEHQRDSVGQYKGYVQREAEELNKRRAIRSADEIERELESHKDQLSEVNKLASELGKPTDGTSELERLRVALQKTADEIRFRAPTKPPSLKHLSHRDSVVEFLSEMKTTVTLTRKKMSELSAFKQKIDELTELSITDEATLAKAQQQELNLTRARESSEAQMKIWTYADFAPQDQAIKLGRDLMARLSLLVCEYPDNTSGKYTKEQINANRQKLAAMDQTLSQLRVTLELKKQNIGQYENAESVSCPKCSFSFKPHSNVRVYEEDRATLARVIEQGRALKEEREVVAQYLREVETFLQVRNGIYDLLGGYGFCSGLTRKFQEQEATGTNATSLTQLCLAWIHDLEAVQQIHAVDQDLSLVRTAIMRAQAILEQPQIELHEPGKVEKDLNECLVRIRSCEAAIVDAQQYLEHLDRYTFLINSYKENLSKYKAKFNETEGFLVKSLYTTFQHEISGEVDRLDREMNGSELANSMCDRFTKLREESEAQVSAGKRLLELLGPTEGLIAEYLYPFLQAFVNELNQFIQSIWTTDLTILPCSMDKGEIDYKFPVRVGTDQHARPDVSDMSSAQGDVVNFAFRFLVSHTLGFHDYPLYIDELDPSYDETHRVNAINYVKQYVLANSCSQLFMISHYVSNHSIFTHADFIVMNRHNLVHMPLSFNQHVQIEEL